VPPKNFYELDRLAYIVRAIETECQVIPIGAYKLTPNHELRLNEAFAGLTLQEASDINNYQHFRNPISEDKKAFICKHVFWFKFHFFSFFKIYIVLVLDFIFLFISQAQDDVLFKFNFFDPLTSDLPMGCWSIQKDASGAIVNNEIFYKAL